MNSSQDKGSERVAADAGLISRGAPRLWSQMVSTAGAQTAARAPRLGGGDGGCGQRGPGLKSSHRKLKPCFLEKACSHTHTNTLTHLHTNTPPPHTYTNTLTLTHTLMHSHTLIHTHTHTHIPYSHTLTHINSHTHIYTHTQTHTNSHPLTHTNTHSDKHSHTNAHKRTHSHKDTHTLLHTHCLAHTHSRSRTGRSEHLSPGSAHSGVPLSQPWPPPAVFRCSYCPLSLCQAASKDQAGIS